MLEQIPPVDLRFVVLRHEGIDDPHFDLMFERSPGSALVTWRSDIWPLVPDTKLVQLADHRRAYLDYEGPISGNRGHVRRVTAGTFHLGVAEQTLWRIERMSPALTTKWIFSRAEGDTWIAHADLDKTDS